MKKLFFLSGMLFFGSMSIANANTNKITKLETIENASSKLVTYTINDPELGNITISVPENVINNSAVWGFDVCFDSKGCQCFSMSGSGGSMSDVIRELRRLFFT